jgi:hypothetical protein
MSDVPSNLIPTRITQLPVAPVADENSLMMIVYQGNNYQIRVGDLLSVAGVPTSRQVIAGTGMTGGGQLTSNVTLSVAPKGVNGTLLSDTGVASGVYGNATNIPVFTVDSTGRVTAATTIPATITGYVPTTTQVIAGNGLTGGGALSGNVTLAASYSASAPQAGFQTGSAGVANTIARSDHKHPAVDLSADDQVDNLLGLGNGGTARSLVPAAGAIVWSGADGLYIGPVGIAGQVLVSGGAGAPTWGSALLVIDQPANVVYAGPAAGAAAPTAFRSLVNADLPASGVTANTYGSTTAIPVITVNAKGVITSVTTAAITGGLVYQGSWNASTNTPTLTSSVGTNGYYYVVSVAGSTNLNGITDWQVGDWAIYNGTAWQKIDQTNLVSSVNGQTGVVSIAYADLAGSIPTWNQNTTGTAAGLSTTLAIASGGSGQTTAQAAMNAFAGAVTSGSYLRGNGTNVVMNTIQVADVPTLNQNTTGTAAGLSATLAIGSGGTGQTTASAAFNALSPITTTGDLILGNGTNSATRLAIGANGYLLSSNGTTASWQPAPAGGVTTFAGGTTGLTPASATSGAISLAGTLVVSNGGTGATTLTGYVKGAGTTALTASSTIPNTDITGLGTMSTQNANSVAVTGGAIDGTTIGATTATTGAFTTATASTSVTTPTVQATGSGGLALKNSTGTTQMLMGAGGGDNLAVNVSTNLNGTNAQIDISPTGTGHVHIKPAGSGSIEIAPTSVGTINNMSIGATTASTVRATTVTTTGTGSSTDGSGQVYLNGATSNRIDFNTNGTGAPAFTTRSAGTKLVLYPSLSGSVADYAIGINAATMWSSIPENNSSFKFKWYGATTEVASLDGAGAFTAVGGISGGTF